MHPGRPLVLAAVVLLGLVPGPGRAAGPVPGLVYALTEGELSFSPKLEDPAITYDFGSMRNLTARDAVGLSFFFRLRHSGLERDPQLLFGVRPRYRRWLNRAVSVDVGPGIAWGPSKARGFSGTADLNFLDLVSLTAGCDAIRRPGHGSETSWYAGYRLGRWAAAVGSVALVVVSLIRHEDGGAEPFVVAGSR